MKLSKKKLVTLVMLISGMTCILLSTFESQSIINDAFYADSTRNWVYSNDASVLPGTPVLVRSVAWFDTRSFLNDTPCLRLHILYPNVKVNHSAMINTTMSITGMVWSNSREKPLVLDKWDFYSLHTGKVYSAYGVNYSEALISLRLENKQQQANKLSLTINGYHIPKDVIKIKKPLPSKQKLDFGVCVKPLYRHRDDDYAPLFIEWIETLRMFGVQQFHIYNCSLTLSNAVQRVFDYYINAGVLVLHQFHTPFSSEAVDPQLGYSCVGPQHKAALSDCMYENMHRFRYLLILDPDELIVPYRSYTYHSMLRQITEENPDVLKGSSISFIMKFFYQKESPSILSNERFLSMRYTLSVSSYVLPGTKNKLSYLSKSFVDPERCIFLYSHGCTYSPFERFYVSTIRGSTHHYRTSCDVGYVSGQNEKFSPRCEVFKRKYRNETRMLRFKDELTARFNGIIELVNI